MALPNNRRIFDMGAHTYKQAKTIIVGPYELPLGIRKVWQSFAISCESISGFDVGRPEGDESAMVNLIPLPGGHYSISVLGQAQRSQDAEGRRRDDARGRHLCEVCFDAMTDGSIPAIQSPTGLEMAWCGCKREHEK